MIMMRGEIVPFKISLSALGDDNARGSSPDELWLGHC